MKYGFSIIALNIALAGMLAPAAMAQSTGGNSNPFFRHRFVAVSERAQPEFDPQPLHAGAFFINSSLKLAALYNDNIFAQDNNKHGDTLLTIRPQADISSNWSRNAINAGFNAERRQYLNNDSENTTDYQGYVGGRLDVTRDFALNAQVNGGHFNESRYAPSAVGSAAKPIHYNQTGGLIGANYLFNRIKLEGTVDVTKNDYDDGYLIGIGPLDQQFRDATTTNVGGRASYAISPDVAVFFQAKHSDVDYRIKTPDRNSTSNYYQIGSSFELAAPFRGDVAVGYVQTRSKTGEDFDGPAVNGRIQWFPTQITTVTFTASRSVFDPGLLQASTAFDTAVGVHIDHELRRNIVLFGDLGYEDLDFQGFDRKDTIVNVGAGVGYKVNRHARLDLGYTFRDQDTSGTFIPAGPKFRDNIVSLSLKLFP